VVRRDEVAAAVLLPRHEAAAVAGIRLDGEDAAQDTLRERRDPRFPPRERLLGRADAIAKLAQARQALLQRGHLAVEPLHLAFADEAALRHECEPADGEPEQREEHRDEYRDAAGTAGLFEVVVEGDSPLALLIAPGWIACNPPSGAGNVRGRCCSSAENSTPRHGRRPRARACTPVLVHPKEQHDRHSRSNDDRRPP
jgi:hypothetical protein